MWLIDLAFAAISLWFFLSLVFTIAIPLGWLMVKISGGDPSDPGSPADYWLGSYYALAWVNRKSILRNLFISGVLVVPTLFYWG